MKQLYFTHDYDAKSDPKLQRLMMEMGMEGIGLYWCVVEDLYMEGGHLPMSAIKTMSWKYRIDEKKVDSVIREFDLFTIENGSFTSNSVLRRLEKVSEISEKRKQAIKKRWDKLTKDSNEIQMNNNCNSNEIQRKEKESKEDERKVKEIKEDKVKEDSKDNDEEESSSSHRIKYDEFVKKYNNWAKENGFPNVKALSDARRKKIKSIVSDFDLDMIDKVLSICSSSDFLKGCNDRNWHADFDFIFTKSKFIKILEGSYSGKEHEGDNNNHSDEISMKLKEWAEEN